MLRLFIPILFTNLLVIFAQNTSQFNPYVSFIITFIFVFIRCLDLFTNLWLFAFIY